jgi:hypothetical protein
VTYCKHNVTSGYCLDCLRASRDAALARVGVLDGVVREALSEMEVAAKWLDLLDATAHAHDMRGRAAKLAALASPPPHATKRHDPATCPDCKKDKALGVVDPDYGFGEPPPHDGEGV